MCCFGARLARRERRSIKPAGHPETEHAMRLRRDFLKCCAALLVVGLGPVLAARGQDILYVGDGGDDTIKRFDATTGAFLGVSDGPAISGPKGPRGIVI